VRDARICTNADATDSDSGAILQHRSERSLSQSIHSIAHRNIFYYNSVDDLFEMRGLLDEYARLRIHSYLIRTVNSMSHGHIYDSDGNLISDALIQHAISSLSCSTAAPDPLRGLDGHHMGPSGLRAHGAAPDRTADDDDDTSSDDQDSHSALAA
jgi:hypothetical protein